MCTPWDAVTAWGTWAVFAATAGLVATGIYALQAAKRQIETQRELARIDNLEKQLVFFESAGFQRVRRALAASRTMEGHFVKVNTDDPPASLYEILNFFEHLGFLVRLEHLRKRDVWHTFAYWAVPVYLDAREVIALEQFDDPSFYDDFVWLIKEMQNIERQETGSEEFLDDEDLYDFYLLEKQDPGAAPRKARKRSRNT